MTLLTMDVLSIQPLVATWRPAQWLSGWVRLSALCSPEAGPANCSGPSGDLLPVLRQRALMAAGSPSACRLTRTSLNLFGPLSSSGDRPSLLTSALGDDPDRTAAQDTAGPPTGRLPQG